MEDVEGVALVGEIVDRPPQRRLTALGEIHRHSNFPIFHHLSLFLSLQFLSFSGTKEGKAHDSCVSEAKVQ